MIVEARTYIKSRIETCLTGFIFIDDSTGDDDVADHLLTQSYKLYFGDIESEAVGNSYTDIIPAFVEIYGKAPTNIDDPKVSESDRVQDLALQVRNTIIDPLVVQSQSGFSYVLPIGIAKETMETNDKAFKITLSFSVIKEFSF